MFLELCISINLLVYLCINFKRYRQYFQIEKILTFFNKEILVNYSIMIFCSFKEFWYFQILTFSGFERFWYFQIRTFSGFEGFWHFQILTSSDSDVFRLWHFQILLFFGFDKKWIMTFSDSDLFSVSSQREREREREINGIKILYITNIWSYSRAEKFNSYS